MHHFLLLPPHSRVPSQAEEFRTAVQMLLEWLSEAEQTLRFRGILPEEVETLQALLHTHRDFMQTVEEKRVDVNKAAGMGEAILSVCHPDCITTIKHWITIIRARFEEVVQLGLLAVVLSDFKGEKDEKHFDLYEFNEAQLHVITAD